MTDGALQVLRERLPMLGELEDETLLGLDGSDWCVPSNEAGRRLAAFGDQLGVYLMSYRAGCDGGSSGLCRLLRPARLGSRELTRLRRLESTYPGLAIVAYERPLAKRQ